MLELDADNVLDYLRHQQVLPANEPARAELLGWGVSNVVIRVSCDTRDDLVIKQSRGQLRTPDPWFSRLDRIFREMDLMRLLGRLLPSGVVPAVRYEDRANYLFAMEAVPADHVVWKQALLEGTVEQQIAERLGTYLATIHRETCRRDDLREAWGDVEVFDQLRIDPFYRRLAEKFPDSAAEIAAAIDSLATHASTIVLADFSPKNILLSDSNSRITLVDFETGHYGDPSFDLGFFLSHLLLKTVLHRHRHFDAFCNLTRNFWQSYRAGMLPTGEFPHLERRTFPQLALCMWARIDGTSQVDYLRATAEQEFVREFCRETLHHPPADWEQLLSRLEHSLAIP